MTIHNIQHVQVEFKTLNLMFTLFLIFVCVYMYVCVYIYIYIYINFEWFAMTAERETD
jgi:hypothetical protein